MKVVLILILAFCISCQKKEKDSSGAVLDSSLHGKWERCDVDGSESTKFTQIISDNSVIAKSDFYNNTTCDVSAHVFNSSITYSISQEAPLTLFLSKATFTPGNDSISFGWSIQTYCELSNWTTGIALDITNKDCDGIVFNYGRTYEVSFSRNGNTLTYEIEGETGILDLAL